MDVSWLIFLLLICLLHTSMGINGKSYDTQCGKAEILPSEAQSASLYIIGGKDVAPRMFPWVGYLSFNNALDNPSCTVSLISVKFVLTASHCITNKQCPDTSHVVFGIVKMKSARKKLIYKTVRFFHPKVQQYSPDPRTPPIKINDIALIELEKNVDILGSKGAINTVCLPSPDMPMTGEFFLVGWGATVMGSIKSSETLKYMVSNVLNKTSCPDVLSKFCIKGVKKTETPYRGDSGGPALKLINGSFYVYGVLHGRTIGNKIKDVFYTNVLEFIDWIDKRPENHTTEITSCKSKNVN